MTSPADTSGGRVSVYERLARRNRLVSVLRFAVPAVGAVMVALLGAQLVLVNIGRDFTVGRVGIVDNRINVEAPTYAGRLTDGSTFTVTAQRAEAALEAASHIALSEAKVTLARQDGVTVTALAAAAQLDADAQTVSVPGHTDITQSDGTTAGLDQLDVDFLRQTAKAAGPVTITLPGGTTVEAASMTYDAGAELWQFERATVTLASTPGEMAP